MASTKERFKIKTTNGKYYKQWWLELYDGGSGQWLYVCCDGLAYIFIELIDLEEYMGNEATVKWDVEVSVVDIAAIPIEELGTALDSCGIDPKDLDPMAPEGRLEIAIAAHMYGLKGRLWDSSGGEVNKDLSDEGPIFKKLRKEAREFVENNLLDDENRNALLDSTIVNALGQTAGGYMRGTTNLWDTLRNIKELGEDATDAQKLVLKMYQGVEQTLGAGPVPNDIKE